MSRKYLILMPDEVKELPDEKRRLKNAIEDYFNTSIPIQNVIRVDALKKKYYQ